MRTRNLECAVCGANAGRWKQWWNRDHGTGICAKCASEEMRTLGREAMESSYGRPGIHYAKLSTIEEIRSKDEGEI